MKALSILTIFNEFSQITYSCRCNDEETSTALKITDAPLRFVKKLYNTSFKPGSTATLVCVLNKPCQSIAWNLDGEPLSENRKRTVRVTENVCILSLASELV